MLFLPQIIKTLELESSIQGWGVGGVGRGWEELLLKTFLWFQFSLLLFQVDTYIRYGGYAGKTVIRLGIYSFFCKFLKI